MSSQRLTRERVAQKLRTRQALLDAARDLVAAGRTPTVAEAADTASVSRATAYRYFPSQESLLVEVPLQIGVPTVESLFRDDAPTEAEDRAALVHNALYDHIREHETQFRLFLRNSLLRSLDPDRTDEPLRRAGRLHLLDAALEPLEGQLDAEQLKRLKATLSILIGPEATIVLRDVLHLDHDQARAHGESAVRQVICAAKGSDASTA